ncbi:MAG TPA: hypothetical protein VGG16_09370 [Streptosporangiaceae bacterium]|jgi:hypothetical protein
MGSTRNCEQCGASFAPRREHARFCSARCRVEWNREHAGDAAAGENALDWSLGAMSEVVTRFDQILGWDLSKVVAAVSEAVWWVTLVDATLVRYYPGIYDTVLDGWSDTKRQMIGETLAGLRFVRNQAGRHRDLADFVRGQPGVGWTWRPLPAPTCDELSPHGQEWELTRYQAYQLRLAGHEVTECFALAGRFLTQTAADAAELADPASA